MNRRKSRAHRQRHPILTAPVLIARQALICACVAWTGAQAQSGVRSTTVSASVDSSVSYNVDSRAGGRDSPDYVAELRPGIRIESRSGRIVGSLSYSMGLVHHSKNFDGQAVQNRLNAAFSAEAVEKWMYVDASATVGRQAISAYGQQSAPGSSQDNSNRTEVGTVTLSPYVRGVFGSAVNYEARLSTSATNGWHSIAADSTHNSGSVSLSSAVSGAPIGWGLLATRQVSDYRAGRETQTDRYSASLSFAPDADLNLTLRGGQEANDVASVSRTSYSNWGAGVTWRPTPRTRAQLDTDDRYFGRSYRVLLEHRMASSSVQFSSSRDASSGSEAGAAGQTVTLYQVFFAQFASLEPDSTQRDLLVRNFLQAQGLDPNAVVAGGFLNTAVTLLERHQLTLAYSGRRVAASVQAFSSDSRVIDAAALVPLDESTRQWGYLATASYRLTPTANVALSGSRLLTQGTPTRVGTELKSISLSLSDQLARRTSATLSLRYSVFNSVTAPYREAALMVALNQRF